MLFFNLLTCQITISHGINTLILVDRYVCTSVKFVVTRSGNVRSTTSHYPKTGWRNVNFTPSNTLAWSFNWDTQTVNFKKIRLSCRQNSTQRNVSITSKRRYDAARSTNGHNFAYDISKWSFLNGNDCILNEISQNCSSGSSLQACFGSDNSLAPNRWHVIIWTIDGQVHRHILTSLGSNELGNNEIWKAVVLPLISYPFYAPCT